MARLIGPPGGEGPANEGERRVIVRLVENLPEGWIVIPNIEIPDRWRPAFEYDAIVIGSHAVYVVEIKDGRVPISGDEREWLVNGRSERSPVASAGQKARVLKSSLVDHSQGLSRVWVEPVVILASIPPKLDLSAGARTRVCLLDEAVPHLLDASAVNQPANGIINLVPTILQALNVSGRPRNRVLQFGSYRVSETLEHRADEVVYRARHVDMPNAPDVRMRVVSLSPYLLTEQQRGERKAQLVRDAEALARMGTHPNVEAARECFLEADQMVVVLPLGEGRSLRQRVALGTPLTVEERLRILADVARGLAHAHAHHVIHRSLAPEHVLLTDDGTARVAHFSLAKIEGASGPTVFLGSAIEDLDPQYLAPEIRDSNLGRVSPPTDLYSLGSIAWELFAGSPPFVDPGQAFAPLPPAPVGMPAAVAELVAELLRGDPLSRPSNAAEVLTAIEACLGDASVPSGRGPKPRYEAGDVIDGKFEVRERLGGGGFSDVYRVYWAMGDCERAVKVFNGKSGDDFKAVQREVSVLVSIQHSNVVRVFDADQTQSGQWYLVCEFIDGEPLSNYVEGSKGLSIDQAVESARDLLKALEAIHPDERRIAELKALGEMPEEDFAELQGLEQRGIVHRDIKPHNLMLTSRGTVLIDFNIASRAGSPADTQAATPAYRAPDAAFPTVWTVTVDLFAAGVTLYELICREHPYEGASPRLDRRPRDPRQFRPELSQEIAEFLVRACAPTADERFATAVEMRSSLEEIGAFVVATQVVPGALPLPPELAAILASPPPNVNPMVSEFLELAAQARRSNRATRGLTSVAELTYVATRLDDELVEAVLEGKHRLVLITGNAGDGKTAFIQQIERLARMRHAEVVEERANGNTIRYLTREIVTLYDGSQDEEGWTSDDVLARFLAPLSADGVDDGAVRVAAINEGRLRDFVVSHRSRFPRLEPVIPILDNPTGPAEVDGLVVVNLNLRSVTTGGANSILSRQMASIVDPRFWTSCAKCDYRLRCPIKHNADTFGDPVSGAAVVERLRLLVDLVRLRRRRHLTMRDVRSLIAHVLFRDRDCAEIAQILADGTPMDIVDLAYFQALGNAGVPYGSEVDRGGALLSEIDVALVANPEDDRRLASGSPPLRMAFPRRDSDYPAELLAKARSDAGIGYEMNRAAAQRAHRAQRRLAFFERSDDEWWAMLPYAQLRRLEQALGDADRSERDRLLQDIVRAISASEGVHGSDGALWLATSDDLMDGGLRAYRRFLVNEFEVAIANAEVPYVEFSPDHLELRHSPSGASLVVDLDLIEVLDRLVEGSVPSLDESRGILVNLALFKHRLLAEPASDVYLMGEDGAARISAQSGGRVALSGPAA
jgi:serine/threonine protein kinase